MSVGAASAALIGAGGAVVGGGLTAGLSIWNERWIHSRTGAEIEAQNERDLRTAARLVHAEMESNKEIYAAAKGSAATWVLNPSDVIVTTSWDSHRSLLTAELPDQVWKQVTNAFLHVEAGRLGPASAMPDIADQVIARLARALEAIEPFTA